VFVAATLTRPCEFIRHENATDNADGDRRGRDGGARVGFRIRDGEEDIAASAQEIRAGEADRREG